MNEQLQQALAVILNKATQGAEAGISFLSAEVPDVIYQLLMWKLAVAGMNIVLGLLLLLPALFTYRAVVGSYRNQEKNEPGSYHRFKSTVWHDGDGDVTGLALSAIIASGVALFFGGIALVVGTTNGVYILVAPKIYLIEYAASLVK